MKIWFTSDTHYGHTNILKYCNRPFKNVNEMNNEMMSRWNNVVNDEDTVYHLGDFAFSRDLEFTLNILNSLKGNKVLITGNHDRKMPSEIKRRFAFVTNYYEFKVQDDEANRGTQLIVMMHYAMRIWNKSHYGAWQLYGHSHGTLSDDPNALAIDVGVDCHNYTPINYEQIKEIMKKKKFVPIDHHIEI